MKKVSTILFKIIIVLLANLFLISCNPANTQTGKPDTYSSVLKNKVIRVGYINYPPSFIKDPNTGNLSGIMHDVLIEMGKSLDIKIDFVEEVGWGTMIEAIESGKIDLVCTGLWPSSTRGKFADFTDAIYFSPIKAYVKFGNKKFNSNLKAANSKDIKIATIDGEMTSIIAKFDFPNAETISLTQNTDISQVLLNLASQKADITFAEPIVAMAYLKNNPNSIQEVDDIPPIRVFPNVMMIPKGNIKFQSMLNISIEELSNSGVIDKIISKYEIYPRTLYKRQKPYSIK